MARTTLDIDTPVLQELKRLQQTERKPLGRLVSDLLCEALGSRRQPSSPRELLWRTQDMRARVDIGDKEALHAALEDEDS